MQKYANSAFHMLLPGKISSYDDIKWNYDEGKLLYLHWFNLEFLATNLNSYLWRGATPANETAADWRRFLAWG